MKIVLLNLSKGINDVRGGVKVFCNMANEFDKRGHQVTMLFSNDNEEGFYFPVSSTVRCINAYSNVTRKAKRIFRRLANLVSALYFSRRKRIAVRKKIMMSKYAYPDVTKILKFIDADVIIAWQPKAVNIAKSVCKELPVILASQRSPQSIIEDCGDVDLLKKADVIQVLIPEDVDFFSNYVSKEHLVWIPNVVPQYVSTCDYSAKKIINVGSFDDNKNQKLLVEAFDMLKDKYSDWQLELWGRFNEEEEYCHKIQQFVVEHGLVNRVKFCGVTSNVEEVYVSGSIFAFPSKDEGFGLVMAEAMSKGMAVVGLRETHGINYLVQGGKNGMLCNGNCDSLVDTLDTLMCNKNLREKLGIQAKQDMKEYDDEKIWNKWEVLVEMIGGQNVRN